MTTSTWRTGDSHSRFPVFPGWVNCAVTVTKIIVRTVILVTAYQSENVLPIYGCYRTWYRDIFRTARSSCTAIHTCMKLLYSVCKSRNKQKHHDAVSEDHWGYECDCYKVESTENLGPWTILIWRSFPFLSSQPSNPHPFPSLFHLPSREAEIFVFKNPSNFYRISEKNVTDYCMLRMLPERKKYMILFVEKLEASTSRGRGSLALSTLIMVVTSLSPINHLTIADLKLSFSCKLQCKCLLNVF